MLKSLTAPLVGTPVHRLYKKVRRLPLIAKRVVMDRNSLHDFWREPEPDGNIPADYIRESHSPRSKALLELISYLPKDAHILEVGCNAGRNVAHLYNAGYVNIEAVEISPHAVALLRKTYPELADVPIHLGAAEDVLHRFGDSSFDLVFTMAVLEHIHPDSECVFDDIARIAKQIIACEPNEGFVSSRQYPRDIRKVFEARGKRLTKQVPFAHGAELNGYSAFFFV